MIWSALWREHHEAGAPAPSSKLMVIDVGVRGAGRAVTVGPYCETKAAQIGMSGMYVVAHR